MSATPPRTRALRRTLRELLRHRRPGSRTPHDATPTRRVPTPRYEALAIGLGCDHLGRHHGTRRDR